MARLVSGAMYGPAIRSVDSAIGVLSSARGRLVRGAGAGVAYRQAADTASRYISNAMAEIRTAGPTEITKRSLELLSQAQAGLQASGFSGPPLPPPLGPVWGMPRVAPGPVTALSPQGVVFKGPAGHPRPTPTMAERVGITALTGPLQILYSVKSLLRRYSQERAMSGLGQKYDVGVIKEGLQRGKAYATGVKDERARCHAHMGPLVESCQTSLTAHKNRQLFLIGGSVLAGWVLADFLRKRK